MPNVMKVLKEEIARISRKEVKAAVAPIRRPSAKLRRHVANLKRRVAQLERETKRLHALLKTMETSRSAAASVPEAEQKARITAKGMRSLRRKLRLSQAEFAALARVTGPAVAIWEGKEGPLRVRSTTRKAILALRGIGAREARKRLADLKLQKPREAVSKRRKARRRAK